MKRSAPMIVLALLALMGFCPRANAQWPVVDVGAIAQLIQHSPRWSRRFRPPRTS